MKLANSVGVWASSFAESGLSAMASIVAAGFARAYGRSAKDAGPEVSHPSVAVSPIALSNRLIAGPSTPNRPQFALQFAISGRLAGYNQVVLTGVQCWVAPATREGDRET